MSARPEELFQNIRAADLASLCSRLVQFNTSDPPGNEREAAEYVAAVLSAAGLGVEMVPHSAERASVVARLKGSGRRPAVLFSGHLDVGPPGEEPWQHDPFAGEVADGKVWGCGASDMKGGVAAQIAAAQILAAAQYPLQGDLILAFSAGEEAGFTGAHEIVARCKLEPVQALFIAEPSHNDVVIAEKGVLWLEITTYGQAIHMARIERGRNAILMMLPVLRELEHLPFPSVEHPLLGSFVHSINMIHGGFKVNTIPDRCTVTVDMRTVPGQDHQTIVAQIESLLVRLTEGAPVPDFRASLQVILDAPPLANSPQDPVIQRFYDIVAEVTGRRPLPQGVGAGTDAVAFVPRLKIPFLMCGPGNPQLVHHTDENVEIAKLVESTKIYLLAATRFLG